MRKPSNLLHFIRILRGKKLKKYLLKPADKTFKEIVKFWKDVDQLSIQERMTRRAEYMEGTRRRGE